MGRVFFNTRENLDTDSLTGTTTYVMTEDIDQDNRYLKAKIISCGNLVEGLKDGDTIYYDKHAGHDISWRDTLYRVIRDGDVVLVD